MKARHWFSVLLVIGSLGSVAPIKANASTDPGVFVTSLVDRVIADLTKGDTSLKSRSEKLRAILDSYFDMEATAKFVLGVYYKTANADERKQFTEIFTEFLSVSYGKRFGDYTGQQIAIDHITQDSATLATVYTRIKGDNPDESPRIDWILRMSDSKEPRIVDVRIEGLSLATTLRDEFSAVMAKSGGVSGLTATLRKKIDITLASAQ